MPVLTAIMPFVVGLVVLAFSAVALVVAFRTNKVHQNIDWLLFGLGVATLFIGGLIIFSTHQYV